MNDWDATHYAAQDSVLRVLRREAGALFELAAASDAWHAPTACPGWDEALDRLRADFEKMMEICYALSATEWRGQQVTHRYLGPLPAYFYPVSCRILASTTW